MMRNKDSEDVSLAVDLALHDKVTAAFTESRPYTLVTTK